MVFFYVKFPTSVEVLKNHIKRDPRFSSYMMRIPFSRALVVVLNITFVSEILYCHHFDVTSDVKFKSTKV